jgi:hypothetical protein
MDTVKGIFHGSLNVISSYDLLRGKENVKHAIYRCTEKGYGNKH